MRNSATPPTRGLRATSCMDVVRSTLVCPLDPGVQSPAAHSCHHRSVSLTAPSVPTSHTSAHLMRTHAAASCVPTWQWGQGTAQLQGVQCTHLLASGTRVRGHADTGAQQGGHLLTCGPPQAQGCSSTQRACLLAPGAAPLHTCSKARCAHLLVFGRL